MRDGVVPLNEIFVPTGPGSFVMSIKYGSGQEPAPEAKQKIVVPPTPKLSVAEKIKKEVEKTSPRDFPDAGVGTGLWKKSRLPDVGLDESSTDRHSVGNIGQARLISTPRIHEAIPFSGF